MQAIAKQTDDGIVRKPEFDKYGNYTGTDYYECERCGFECVWRDAVESHDCPEGR